MKPVILMRASLAEYDELRIAEKYFPVYRTRAEIPRGSLVIGRYSVLPYHKELEEDVKILGSRLINTTRQHSYVADVQAWYGDIVDQTPTTWFNLADFKFWKKPGSFVLKGQTNSKKQQWNTHMFAETAEDVDRVYKALSEDGFLSSQEIYIRQYEPLRSFGEGIRGMPITEEYRFFVLDGKIVGSGFYWSQYPEVAEKNQLTPDAVPRNWLQSIINDISPNVRFFVIDVGRKIDHTWIVIELNDGCMSGLSMVEPEQLYSNLAKELS